MPPPRFADHRRHFALIQAAIGRAADPGAAVRARLSRSRSAIRVGGRLFPLKPGSQVVVIGFGKAAAAMAQAAAEILGDAWTRGLVVVPHGSGRARLPRTETVEAGHPLPDEGSLLAGREAERLLAGLERRDYVLALVSGGGSALLELPREGLALDDLRATQGLLLRSGAPIEDLNTVRRALSRLKGGGLARLASPARTLGLILSDVVGDRLEAIASGPTVLAAAPGPGFGLKVLRRSGIEAQVPSAVLATLANPPAPRRPAPRPFNQIVAGNRGALAAARREAQDLGFKTRLITARMTGEAREVGAAVARRLRRAVQTPVAHLLGGETTVTVRGSGRGGRNQELALAAAIELEGAAGVALMALATDGVDGPTDSAGAIVTGATMPRLRQEGVDPAAALDANDSYPALERAGALIRSGPTGTNVSDIVVALRYPHEAE
ncbi:MAG: glycerate kinase type-2 family protein [Anaerolineales bacterium]